MSTSHVLKFRSDYRSRVRAFFEERGVLEVDTPYLNPAAQIDRFIEPVHTELGYLPTSPEHFMKRLLAAGAPDIYQICKAFRKNESGPLHSPEFTMIEWYRRDTTFSAFIRENLDLIALFLPNLPSHTLTYEEALGDAPPEDDIAWANLVEPRLGQNELTVVTDWPPSMAALARTKNNLAQRFEIYYRGIELANGFHELNDPTEQRRRYTEANVQNLPLDEPFIEAVRHLPETCHGVALGFDRLLMLAADAPSLHHIL